MLNIKNLILGWSVMVGLYVLGLFIYDSVTVYNLQAVPVIEGPAVSYYLMYELRHIAIIFLYWGLGVIVINMLFKIFSKKSS